jgi:CRISPR/Cas system-associated protein Cas7 (RAMP superfamily)
MPFLDEFNQQWNVTATQSLSGVSIWKWHCFSISEIFEWTSHTTVDKLKPQIEARSVTRLGVEDSYQNAARERILSF